MSHRPLLLLSALALCVLPLAGHTADAPNLARNPGLEAPLKGELPEGWSPVVIGAPARFAVDGAERHGGAQSVRITAPEVTRSYVVSDPIDVAPGERLEVSAWVKQRDVPPGQGTVIVFGEFLNTAGSRLGLAKVDVAKPGGEWQEIRGSIAAPELAVRIRLFMGFSYASGTTWWDDVTVRAMQGLVLRTELPNPRFSPAMPGLPVGILNREGRRGVVNVRVTLGAKTVTTPVMLTGAMLQRITVPVEVTGRGRAMLQVALLPENGETPLFSEKRQVTIPAPLTLSPPIPTHWVREDGPPQVEAEVDVELAEAVRRSATLTANLIDAQGTTRATWSAEAGRPVPGGFTRFTLRAPELPVGEYRLQAQLQQPGSAPVQVEQPWSVIPKRRVEVTLNPAGYLVKDGKPVFPLGIFNGGARMAEAGTAGFTVSHAYNAVRVELGQLPDDQRAKDFLDSTQKAGMSAIFFVPNPWAQAGEWDAFRRRIRMFRNHPALLAWDEEEGLARGDMKPETLARIRQVLREEDPRHPLMVGDSRDVITRVTDRSNFFPLANMDLGMWWWYPFPLTARSGDALQGEDGNKGLELEPPTFLTKRSTGKPLWVGVQSYKKPGAGARYPNAAEYRAQAYLAVIHGAKGLMWYGGSVTGGLFLSPKEGDWEALKRLATELHGLSDVFMSPDAQTPKLLPENAKVSAVIKRTPERTVLLAVNRAATSAEVTFQLPAGGDEPVTVLGEGRTVKRDGTALRDRFEAYGTHVYVLSGP